MKIKENLEIYTQDFFYDLTDGGYLDPFKICADTKDAQRVKEAVDVLMDFRRSCEDQIPDFIQ